MSCVSLRDDYRQAPARARVAWASAERGDFASALTVGREALRMAEGLDHPFTLVVACMLLGHVHATRGDLGEAARLFDRADGVARAWNLRFWYDFIAWCRGRVEAQSGRIAEGLALLAEALR